jgi:hypothetical protein
MSGTFERQRYDTKAYETDLKQSTGPLMYYMNPIRNDTNRPSRVVDAGFTGKVGVSVTHMRPLVDVESDLLGLDIKNSKDPNQLYQPKCPQCGINVDMPIGSDLNTGCMKCHERLYNLPKAVFNQDYTRLSNPVCTSREVGLNRFQDLNLNPQEEKRWLQQSEVGINYRMIVKDNHVPLIPVLRNQNSVLPRGTGDVHMLNSKGTWITDIGPHHKYAKIFSSFSR